MDKCEIFCLMVIKDKGGLTCSAELLSHYTKL